MAVDMHALRKVATGDSEARITVNRRYLSEIYKLLVQANIDAVALATLRSSRRDGLSDVFGDIFKRTR